MISFVKKFLAFNKTKSSDIKNEDQLIYIITLMLKKEINNLKNNESCCRIILKEFYKKKEVKYFLNLFFMIFSKY